jgi:hypothetical protein
MDLHEGLSVRGVRQPHRQSSRFDHACNVHSQSLVPTPERPIRPPQVRVRHCHNRPVACSTELPAGCHFTGWWCG